MRHEAGGFPPVLCFVWYFNQVEKQFGSGVLLPQALQAWLNDFVESGVKTADELAATASGSGKGPDQSPVSAFVSVSVRFSLQARLGVARREAPKAARARLLAKLLFHALGTTDSFLYRQKQFSISLECARIIFDEFPGLPTWQGRVGRRTAYPAVTH